MNEHLFEDALHCLRLVFTCCKLAHTFEFAAEHHKQGQTLGQVGLVGGGLVDEGGGLEGEDIGPLDAVILREIGQLGPRGVECWLVLLEEVGEVPELERVTCRRNRCCFWSHSAFDINYESDRLLIHPSHLKN